MKRLKFTRESGGSSTDGRCSTFRLTVLVERRAAAEIGRFFRLALDRRPARQLDSFLRKTSDPPMIDAGDVLDTYEPYRPIRTFQGPDDRD